MKALPETKHQLPAKIEGLLATLSASYGRKKEVLLQRIVVNASYKVDEGYDYDNWDGGQTGHLIHLAIPAALFLDTMDTLAQVEDRIAADLNSIAKCPHEHVSAVTVEQAETDDFRLWREKSGALMTSQRSEMEITAAADHLWTKGCLRAFLSHKAEHKKTASDLKSSLLALGVSVFVAHEDIEPTKEWLDEIELALSTQDVCVALLTEGFHDSKWTDQEIGISIGRGVSVVAVRLGEDPYGFIGKFQAVSGGEKKSGEIANELVSIFLSNPRLYSRMADALVQGLENSNTYEMANALMKHIKVLPTIPQEMILRLEQAFERNLTVKNAYTVQNLLPGVLQRLKMRP